MKKTRTFALASLLLIPTVGCGGDDNGSASVLAFTDPLLRGSFAFTADGGPATGSATNAFGGFGGLLKVTAVGNILVGQNPPPLAPKVPAPPGALTPVVSWTDDQVISAGGAVVNGTVIADSTAGTATLTVTTGDVVVAGSLVSSDFGTLETDIVIKAPAGTVWITGTIRTGRVDGVADGDDAGNLTISAQRIIFTGTIESRGEDGAELGGSGGSITFDTGGSLGQTSQLLVGGSVNVSGGNATGADAAAGHAGSFYSYESVSANGSLQIINTVITATGGSATGTGVVEGGFGGFFDLQADGGVFFNATLLAGGGSAQSDVEAYGGPGGYIWVNDKAVADAGPCSFFGTINFPGGSASCGPGGFAGGGGGGGLNVTTGSDVNLGAGIYFVRGADSSGRGGGGGGVLLDVPDGAIGDISFDSDVVASAGNGTSETNAAGGVSLTTDLGDIQISGTLELNGGDGSSPLFFMGPSDAGYVIAQAGNGDSSDGGSITFRGTIVADGGSDVDGSDDNDGGDGGIVEFTVDNPAGSIYLEGGSGIHLDGGASGGPTSGYLGGHGGFVTIRTTGGSILDGTVGGNININGSIVARGGPSSPAPGAQGGYGGTVLVQSDSPSLLAGGGDGRGGDIHVLSAASIDLSGGPGDIGGDAQNDYAAGVTFPVAVTLDSDGADSDDPSENGVVVNAGAIVAQGQPPGGYGGDVLFDGLDSAFNVGPLPGFLDLFGPGLIGDFLSR